MDESQRWVDNDGVERIEELKHVSTTTSKDTKEALEEKRIEPGDHILMASFGAGLTYGASLIKWGDRVVPLKSSDAKLPPCQKTALELIAAHIERYKTRDLSSTS